MRDDGLTDRNKTDRLVDEFGLSAGETKAKRFPISPTDVRLIAWLVAIPEMAKPAR